jgi:hypothetical protein
MANIAQIKEQLGLAQLNLNTALDAKGVATDWMRHWENDTRTAISIHKDTVAAIKADPNVNLGLQEEKRTSEKGEEYRAIRIVKFTPAEMTL